MRIMANIQLAFEKKSLEKHWHIWSCTDFN